ncbi:MAG: BlaI/MecI/CopY family transcriptional regulator [Planctomycetota bacterium]
MQLSEAEWRIMNRVWEDHPVTAREVLDSIESDWAYTTVKTMMTRLQKKGVLKEKKRDGVSYYEPKLTRQRARGTALRALVDRAFGGALGGMMSHLVEDEKLTKKQRDELRRMLEEGK